MKTKVLLSFSTSIFVCIFSHAAYAGSWDIANRKIVNIIIQSATSGDMTGSHIHVVLDGGADQNPDNCGNIAAGPLVRIDGDTQLGKYELAQIMLAQTTGKSVQVYYNGCDDWGFRVMAGIQLHTP